MNFEDHFSELAETYSMYRPGYPDSLFKFLSDSCKNHVLAWDCGTGSGQAASALVNYFEKVIATDASADQINKAVPHPRIIYKVETAENAAIENSSVDLVSVAVAVHWFNFETFYQKVKDVLKPDGIIAVWTYNRVIITPEVDNLIEKFMYEILDGYWPERFDYVKTGYSTLPFFFTEIKTPVFEMTTEWDLNQLTGFLSSWSGTKNYINKNNRHPLREIHYDLKNAWGDENKKFLIRWPLHVRIGKK